MKLLLDPLLQQILIKDDAVVYVVKRVIINIYNDDVARNSLVKLLVLVDLMCGSPLMIRQFNDKRLVANELPKKVNAFIFHKRFYIRTFLNQTIETVAPSDNIC